MARNTLKLDMAPLTELIKKIDAMGGDAQRVTEKALEKASQKIKNDTVEAMAKANLPAQGKYSTGTTMESIVGASQAKWDGSVGWVPVGFDFSKPGAGGYLITGTPRMQPDAQLNKMYKKKAYMSALQQELLEDMWDEILKLSEA